LSLSGKRILVTGCGGGIGSAISANIVEHGGELLATDRGDAGADVARRLNAVYFPLDVTDEANWLDVAQQVASRYGVLDGLVNNAGVILMKPLLQTTLADYRRINAINNEGVLLGMRTLAPLLAKSNSQFGAAIVNFSSIYGLGGQPGFSAYCAAKGAVRLVTKAAALEFAQAGMKIRVNSVHPGRSIRRWPALRSRRSLRPVRSNQSTPACVPSPHRIPAAGSVRRTMSPVSSRSCCRMRPGSSTASSFRSTTDSPPRRNERSARINGLTAGQRIGFD
jgi:NAD(P)-dependent dehydrogenase (short-subunit alcohol dehydrogenase family)